VTAGMHWTYKLHKLTNAYNFISIGSRLPNPRSTATLHNEMWALCAQSMNQSIFVYQSG